MKYRAAKAEVILFEDGFMTGSHGGQDIITYGGHYWDCVTVSQHGTVDYGGVSYPWLHCDEVYIDHGSVAKSGQHAACKQY